MKRYSTLFLKLALIIVGIPVLLFCIYGVYWLLNHTVKPEYQYILYPIVIVIYFSVIPFYIAVFHAFKLLCYIDHNNAFSQLSVKALKNITFCAFSFSALYVTIMPFIYVLAEKDDSPGLIIIGMIPTFASLVIAVFAAVLQKLFEEAFEIKSENDLTV